MAEELQLLIGENANALLVNKTSLDRVVNGVTSLAFLHHVAEKYITTSASMVNGHFQTVFKPSD